MAGVVMEGLAESVTKFRSNFHAAAGELGTSSWPAGARFQSGSAHSLNEMSGSAHSLNEMQIEFGATARGVENLQHFAPDTFASLPQKLQGRILRDMEAGKGVMELLHPGYPVPRSGIAALERFERSASEVVAKLQKSVG